MHSAMGFYYFFDAHARNKTLSHFLVSITALPNLSVFIFVRTVFLACTSRVEKSSVTILLKKYNVAQIFKKCYSLSFEPSGHAV
jgi:hypothetical protein